MDQSEKPPEDDIQNFINLIKYMAAYIVDGTEQNRVQNYCFRVQADTFGAFPRKVDDILKLKGKLVCTVGFLATGTILSNLDHLYSLRPPSCPSDVWCPIPTVFIYTMKKSDDSSGVSEVYNCSRELTDSQYSKEKEFLWLPGMVGRIINILVKRRHSGEGVDELEGDKLDEFLKLLVGDDTNIKKLSELVNIFPDLILCHIEFESSHKEIIELILPEAVADEMDKAESKVSEKVVRRSLRVHSGGGGDIKSEDYVINTFLNTTTKQYLTSNNTITSVTLISRF